MPALGLDYVRREAHIYPYCRLLCVMVIPVSVVVMPLVDCRWVAWGRLILFLPSLLRELHQVGARNAFSVALAYPIPVSKPAIYSCLRIFVTNLISVSANPVDMLPSFSENGPLLSHTSVPVGFWPLKQSRYKSRAHLVISLSVCNTTGNYSDSPDNRRAPKSLKCPPPPET